LSSEKKVDMTKLKDLARKFNEKFEEHKVKEKTEVFA
jgi:hypothetical protein